MQRLLIVGVLVIGLLMAATLAILAWTQLPDGQPAAPIAAHADQDRRAFFDGVVVPPFDLTDQDGQAFTRADLADGEHYVILDFMFSHCVTACPIMSGNMLKVYDRTAGLPIRFVSVSVDPVNDTPERLRAYATDHLGVDTERWRFLSGDWSTVEQLAESLGFSLTPDSGPNAAITLPDGGTMTNIIHPTRFVLFGPDGEIVDSYLGMNPGEVERLLRDIDRLVRDR